MSFFDIIQNLLIGIAGGIFSSIIVSVVFYLLNEFQVELNRANEMIYPLYGIIALDEIAKISPFQDKIGIASECLQETIDNFARFEPWKFKYALHDPMCKINDIIMNGEYIDEELNIYSDKLDKITEEIKTQVDRIETCERNFAKEFMKRVLKNKIIQISMFIFLIFMLLA